jgi:hypothetical protein
VSERRDGPGTLAGIRDRIRAHVVGRERELDLVLAAWRHIVTAKPVLISETAVGPSRKQASQITGLFRGVRQDHLAGLVWFDQAQHDGHYHQDWRLEGDTAAMRAFRAGLNALTPARSPSART